MTPDATRLATQCIFLVIVALNGVLMYLLPRLTRPELFFAVTVPGDFRDRPAGARILRRYRLEVLVHSLIGLALILLGRMGGHIALFATAGVFWQIAGNFVAYLRARREVMPHAVAPATLRETDLGPRPARLPGGWAAQLGVFAILAAMVVWLNTHWEQIPARFPVHWGIDGQPNGWAARTFAGVYGPLIMGACVCAGVGLLAYGIMSWTRRIQVRGGPGQSELRFRRVMLSVLVATQYLVALLFAWVGSLALRSGERMPSPLAVIGPALIFSVLVVVVLIRTGQGGSRLPEYRIPAPPSPTPPIRAREQAGPARDQSSPAPAGDRTLDRYWKAGIFYVNRDDPAIIVEKRFGIGYTLNFGQPMAWIVMGLLVLVPLVLGLILGRRH